MPLTMGFRPEVEVRLKTQAKDCGLSLSEYLEKRLEVMFSVSEPRLADMKAPPLSDEEVSREIIYRERDDKQL